MRWPLVSSVWPLDMMNWWMVVEEGCNKYSLQQQLATAERKTYLKIDGMDMRVGWFNCVKHRLSFDQEVGKEKESYKWTIRSYAEPHFYNVAVNRHQIIAITDPILKSTSFLNEFSHLDLLCFKSLLGSTTKPRQNSYYTTQSHGGSIEPLKYFIQWRLKHLLYLRFFVT